MEASILELKSIAWLGEEKDFTNDLCAHGCVEFRIEGTTFVSSSDGDFAVSTAALFLLRTIERDHIPGDGVTDGNFLFPCSGHIMLTFPKSRYGFVNCGCPNGIDLTIRHRGETVEVLNQKGSLEQISIAHWKEMVKQFAGSVEDFYKESGPKTELENPEEKEAWLKFRNEWKSRMDTL